MVRTGPFAAHGRVHSVMADPLTVRENPITFSGIVWQFFGNSQILLPIPTSWECSLHVPTLYSLLFSLLLGW